MPDPFQPQRESINLESTNDLEARHALSPASPGGTSKSAFHTIDTEPQLIVFNLRASQGLRGWAAIGVGLLLVAAGVLVSVNVYLTHAGLGPNASVLDALAVQMLCSFPALIGLLFLRDGVNSILRGMKRAQLGSEARWNVDFPGRPRTGVNDSAAIAKKTFVNFLWGQIIMIPGFYLGFRYAIAGNNPEKGPLVLMFFGFLWYLAAVAYTVRKVAVFLGSRKLSLQWQQFPILLAHPVSLTLTVAKEVSSFEITEVMLRCIQETTITTGVDRRRIVRRAAQQLYCDAISRPTALSKNTFELSFDLPARGDLKTDLLAEDPIFWCLTIVGTCNNLPIDASFLLPVYGDKAGMEHS
jgi:hypothetical protein